MIDQEKKQQTRQKFVFLVMLAVSCLGVRVFSVSRGMSTYQNNEKFIQVDTEEKFFRLPQYLLGDLALRKDADSHVRYQAAKALGESQAQEAIPQLTLLLKGSDQYVRYFAAEASGKLQSKEVIPQLTLLLKNSDSDVRFSEIRVQGKESIPQLTLWPKDADSDVHFRAIHALGALRELQGKESIPQLMLWPKNADLDTHSSAAKPSSTSYVKDNQSNNLDSASDVMVIRQNLYQELILLGGGSLVTLVLLLIILIHFQRATRHNLVRELIVLLLLKLRYFQQIKEITFLYHLKCYFPEDAVLNLAALRERLIKEKKSIWLIRFKLFYQILTLVRGTVKINVDNLTSPSRDRRIDK